MVNVAGILIVCVRYYYKNIKAFKLYRSRYYEQNVQSLIYVTLTGKYNLPLCIW